MARTILIVEDEEFIRQLLAAYLAERGFAVREAGTAAEALNLVGRQPIDLVLLDLGLPDEDGIALMRRLRALADVPVVVLTARKERGDRIASLQVGADDYITKPVDPEELYLRVTNLLARLKRGERPGEPDQRTRRIAFAGFVLDADARTLTNAQGAEVPLTSGEFNLLHALALAPNRVLTRAHLVEATSRGVTQGLERTVDVLISRLRRKIEADPRRPAVIVTLSGVGYKLVVRPELPA